MIKFSLPYFIEVFRKAIELASYTEKYTGCCKVFSCFRYSRNYFSSITTLNIMLKLLKMKRIQIEL